MAREGLIRLTGSGSGNGDDTPCDSNDCPNVYRTQSGSFLIQGDVSSAFTTPAGESLVEVPEHVLREAVRALGW
ncbi:hypothetical protein ACWD33_00685 [Streptomyces xiamenensis]|uniref:hypothetical protein n=1 Tax=Streptomyces TaxID=1883 RepID=UPI0009973FCE|nr:MULTISPECIES: hypothetical protein [Streptomyces]